MIRVIGLEINQTTKGLELVLETLAGSQKLVPLILPEGHNLIVEFLDPTLAFRMRNGITTINPTPGIKQVRLIKIDDRTVRLTITGEQQTPSAEIVPSKNNLESNLTADDGLPIDPVIFEIPRERFLGDPDNFIDTKTHNFYLTLDHRFNDNINLRSGFAAQISNDSSNFLRLFEFDPESNDKFILLVNKMGKSKKTRDLLFQLHRYLGLFLGILIAIAGITASIMIILSDTEEFFITQGIDRVIPQKERLSLDILIDKAQNDPIAQGYSIVNGISPYTFPNRPLDSPLTVSLSSSQNEDDWIDVILNPYTGQVFGGIWGRMIYFFASLAASILLITGLVMYRLRYRQKY